MAASLSDDEMLELWGAYETGDESLKHLAARFGVTLYALRNLAEHHGWKRARKSEPARPMSWLNKPCPGLGECPERSELIAQSWLLAQKQIDEIELQFADHDDEPGRKIPAPMAHARALGVLVRVLKDLAALDRAACGEGSRDEGQGRIDTDGLRTELARRVAAIRKGQNARDAADGT